MPTNWQAIKVVVLLKYHIVDKEESGLNWTRSNKNPNKKFKPIMTKWRKTIHKGEVRGCITKKEVSV